MEFDLRRDFARYYLPPDASLKGFQERVQADSLEKALEYHRDGLTGGWSTEGILRRQVDDYFDGGTSEEEEDAALGLILSTWRAEDIVALINNLTWDNLDDELDEQDLTRIARHCHQLLDHRDFRVAFLMRWFYLLEAGLLRTRPSADLAAYAASLGMGVRADFAWLCLQDRDAVLDGIAAMALRGQETYLRSFRTALDAPTPSALPLAVQSSQLSWEAHYTDLICHNLEQGEYRPLLEALPQMFQATPPAQSRALFDMLIRWDRHFAAMESLIAGFGTPRQQADMRRFMSTRRALMDSFPAANPPPGGIAGAIAAALAAINSIGNTFIELRDAILRIAETIEGISAPRLLGTLADDEAVAAINRFSSAGTLALLPTAYKLQLAERALSGAVEDEEEQAVLTVLRDTKAQSTAEFMQLAAAITWEKLFNAFDGSEYDELEGLFHL